MVEETTKKKGMLAVIGGGLLAAGGALAAGFFSSVGEKAGQIYLASDTEQSNPADGLTTGPANSSQSTGKPAPAVQEDAESTGTQSPASSPAQPIIIDTVDLSFGAEASARTRGAACADAIKIVVKRAEYQCQTIAQQQNAGSFELDDFEKSCTQCNELSSNWRCVTRVRPVCKIIE